MLAMLAARQANVPDDAHQPAGGNQRAEAMPLHLVELVIEGAIIFDEPKLAFPAGIFLEGPVGRRSQGQVDRSRRNPAEFPGVSVANRQGGPVERSMHHAHAASTRFVAKKVSQAETLRCPGRLQGSAAGPGRRPGSPAKAVQKLVEASAPPCGTGTTGSRWPGLQAASAAKSRGWAGGGSPALGSPLGPAASPACLMGVPRGQLDRQGQVQAGGAGSMPLMSMSSGLGRGLSSTAATAISTADFNDLFGCGFLATMFLRSRAGEGGAEIRGCRINLVAPELDPVGLPRPGCPSTRQQLLPTACQAWPGESPRLAPHPVRPG